MDTKSVDDPFSVDETDFKVNADVVFVAAGVNKDETVEHELTEWTMFESKLEEAEVPSQVAFTAESDAATNEVDEGEPEEESTAEDGVSLDEDVTAGNKDDFGNESASKTNGTVGLSTVASTDEETD